MVRSKVHRFLVATAVALGLLRAYTAFGAEKLDRGVAAIARPDGSVYVGWRLMKSDQEGAGFVVSRQEAGKEPVNLNKQPIGNSTNFVDATAEAGKEYVYRIVAVPKSLDAVPKPGAGPAVQIAGETRVVTPPRETAYISIPLQGKYVAQKVAVADLNGDGALDYVIKQPNFNTDPYQQPGYWKKSEDTYKLEAYRHDGKFLWRYDMGWAIEEGIWYSPLVVYDIDGDGKAEVYAKAGEGDPREPAGHVMKGPEWLVKIDGETGQIVKKIDWPSREGFEEYNRYCRNLMAVAYLDGKKPSLIVQRGTYTLIKMRAYDGQLNLTWQWDSVGPDESYRGQGSHGFHAADVDGDGRDELVYGSACIDENGKPLWNTGKGHPDVIYVGDVDPARPGLEIFYGVERAQKKGGVCLADAKTGQMIWENSEATKHVHGQGMCADIDPDHPGMECYAKERDSDDSWLYSAKGERLSDKPMGGTTPRAVWWDDTQQKALVIGGRISKYKGKPLGTIEGNVVGIADCLGDWREEIITSVPGELRIYTTTVPATTRQPCLMQNRMYRANVATQTMGYFYSPQLGFGYLGE